jgi:transposase
MWVRDQLDGLWEDEDFAGWYPRDGRPGISPAQLATVSVLQFLLELSDRDAAEAVRCRTDFKYALGLDLDDPGFHHSVLGDFRDRLLEDGRTDRLLDLALARLKDAGLVRERTTWRTGSTHVLAAVTTGGAATAARSASARTPPGRRPGSTRPGRPPAGCSSTWRPAILTCCAAPRWRPCGRSSSRTATRTPPGACAGATMATAAACRRPSPASCPPATRPPATPAGARSPAGPATSPSSPRPAPPTALTSSPTSPPCPPPAPAPQPWLASTPGWSAGACSPPSTSPAAAARQPHPPAPRPGGLRPRRLPDRLRPPGSHLPARPGQPRSSSPASPRASASPARPGPPAPPPATASAPWASPPRELYELQVHTRADQHDPAWHKRYAVRSGIEGTICEFAHGHGMRHCRYRGQPKAHLQHVLTAIAVNIVERLSQLPPVRAQPCDHRRPSRITSTSTTSSACAHGEPSAKPQRPRSPTESS